MSTYLRLASTLLALFVVACGGSKNASNDMEDAPVRITKAYYVTQVGGTPEGGVTNTYYLELNEHKEGLRFDTAWVDGQPIEAQLVPTKPLVQALEMFENNSDFREPKKIRVRGYFNEEVFYLESDSLYQQDKVFMPSARPD